VCWRRRRSARVRRIESDWFELGPFDLDEGVVCVRPDPRLAGRLPRRRTDRFEDVATWLLMALGLAVVVLSATVGVRTYATIAGAIGAEAADRTEVDAVTLTDSPLVMGAGEVDPGAVTVTVPVRWTGQDGSVHTAPAMIAGATPAGQPVQIWLDRSGQPVPAPATGVDAVVQAVAIGGLLLAGGTVLVVLAWLSTWRLVERRNALFWEREWARVGPQWTGHGRPGQERDVRGGGAGWL
jgi:hypothetical protein